MWANLSVEHVDWFDSVVDHPDGSVEGSHDVRRRLAVGTRQLGSLRSDGDQKLKIEFRILIWISEEEWMSIGNWFSWLMCFINASKNVFFQRIYALYKRLITAVKSLFQSTFLQHLTATFDPLNSQANTY